jgi:MFS family permease
MTTMTAPAPAAAASPVRTADPVARRLRPLRVALFLQGVAFWLPVEKLFMAQLGFDAAAVALMAAAYGAVVPLLEVPTGILADRWSRRPVLLLAGAAGLVFVLLGGLSRSVPMYIAAAMLLGVYLALQSGTTEAVVYDTVVDETGGSEGYERYLGRTQFAGSAALALSALGGGWLAAATSARATYFVTAPFVAASLVALLRFREPTLHRQVAPVPLRQHLAIAYAAVRGGRGVLAIMVAMALCAMLLQTLFEFGPLWLLALAAPAPVLGPFTAAMVSAQGMGELAAGRVGLDRRGRLPLVALGMAGAGLAVALGRTVLTQATAQVVLAVLLVVVGIHLSRLLHDAVPSTLRAGIGSTAGTLSWLAFFAVALAFGQIARHFGVLATGWLIAALALAAATAVLRATRAGDR